MPFNDNLPAEGTDPWYTPLVTAWNNLKTFVNGLETTLGTKASTSDLTSGLAGKANTSHTHAAGDVTSGTFATARIPDLAISKVTGLQTALDGKASTTDLDNTFQVATDAANLAATKTTGLNGVTGVWAGTQAQYDAISPKVATVFYAITG